MCFIKKLEFGVEPIIYPCEQRCYCYNMQYLNPNQPLQIVTSSINMPFQYGIQFPQLIGHLTSDFATVIERINLNNISILQSIEVLNKNESILEEARRQVEEKLTKPDSHSLSTMSLQPHCQLNDIPFFSNQTIITKIFGQKQYKYKLNLFQQFPKIIYKERNLNIGVKLNNPNMQSLFNANLIHLCIGVCNNLGQWIVEESGEFFIQGKIEIDLYHGEAEFKKISPKDVSRHFNDGIINLVIYPKKSLINFTGEVNKYEKVIDSDLIEPLIIKDIIIKAKKKCKN